MFKSPKFNKKGSSLSQLDIVDIREGILRLTDNRYRLVLRTSSINFELKSEEEQDAIIDIYQGFLNAISFPIQILVRTREINIDDYLLKLEEKLKQESKTIYKNQLKNYRVFIKSLVTDNKILSRHFYVIVPYDSLKRVDFNLAKEQLALRSDIVIKNLNRLGIICYELTSVEVVDLFYYFYSPVSAKIQPLSNQVMEVINNQFVVGAV